MKIYSIFDRVTSTYGEPFFALNDDDCKRKVAYGMRSNPYKPDLQLYFIGSFDIESGSILGVPHAQFICNLLDCYDNVEVKTDVE